MELTKQCYFDVKENVYIINLDLSIVNVMIFDFYF